MQQINRRQGHTRLKQLTLAMLAVLFSQATQAGFKMGDNTEIGIGGYVKLDAMWTDTSEGMIANGPGRDFYVPSAIPVSGTSESAKWDMHARQSRFFITSDTLLENGKKISGRFEFDMMGTYPIGNERTSNGYSPEIRHAFISYDGWLFGQTWTTFMDVNALPDSIDFVGTTDGTVFVRQAQVRYTNGGFQIALENPETAVTLLKNSGSIASDDNSMPDVVLRYNHTADWGGLTVAGLSRQLSYQEGAVDDTTRGYGLTFSGKVNLSKTDDLRFAITYGEGLGRYLSLNTSNDVVVRTDNQLETIKSVGYTLAYKHAWNDQWRSSFFYSGQKIDNPLEFTGTGLTESTASYSANLIYQVASKLSVGAEFRHATRVLDSDLEGDLNRIQFMAKYDF